MCDFLGKNKLDYMKGARQVGYGSDKINGGFMSASESSTTVIADCPHVKIDSICRLFRCTMSL